MLIHREELAWAGGFFEGEGCFTRSIQTRGNCATYTPKAKVNQTYEEPLERYVDALGFGHVNGPYQSKSKEFWYVEVAGFEKVQATLAMLWPFLSERRKQEGMKVLSEYLTHESTRVRFKSC